ncbi:MAG: response regulator [Desulfobulbaceae bacterium]|nr:MAG: response regulator [Desulfobulbaceae bacterium]
MEIICKSCGKSHKSNEKLEASLKKLEPGQKLRFKCSQCQEPIAVGPEQLGQTMESTKAAGAKSAKGSGVRPPDPPDTSWLQDGEFEEEAVVSDIPQAIVLIEDETIRRKVVDALTSLGYRAETADDIPEALEKMQFFNYSSIVMHTAFNSSDLNENSFHTHMCNMNMSRRRYIFYVLIGDEMKTFYNLQALAYSANLVVNESDTSHFGVILRKAIPEYEELFGPYMEEMKVQGR